MELLKDICLIILILTVLLKSNFGKRKSADYYFDLCHRNDPKIDHCLLKSLTKLTPTVLAGIPEIGIPSFDPLFIQELKMVEGSGSSRVSVTISNVSATGLANSVFQKASISIKNESDIVIKFENKVPWLHFKGKYAMEGKILLFPAVGKGDYYMNLTEPICKATLKCRTVVDPKNNKKYIHVDSFTWDFTVEGGKTYFSNLFNGNKVLEETANNFLNNNGVELFKEIKHLPEQAFGELLKGIVNNFFRRFTYDELLLPD